MCALAPAWSRTPLTFRYGRSRENFNRSLQTVAAQDVGNTITRRSAKGVMLRAPRLQSSGRASRSRCARTGPGSRFATGSERVSHR